MPVSPSQFRCVTRNVLLVQEKNSFYDAISFGIFFGFFFIFWTPYDGTVF